MDIITYALCRKNGGGGGGDNTHFIGTTTTAITDGATTNPITVDGESYTAVKGDIVIYDSTEFIFDGSAWQSFGGTMDTQPTKNSAKAVTSDGVYRYTAGQKEYVDGRLKGEIFNSYNQHDIGAVTVSKNQASGADSHAEGGSTTASGSFSHAEGYGNIASGIYSHVEGSANTSSGQSSHTEGHDNKAKGHYSHAEGLQTTANGINAHAEGYKTIATTDDTHAEGRETQAIALSAHAEGFKTFASGQYSHAEGYNTTASGQFSHAGGRNTIAKTDASTAIGKYNIADGTGENDPKHLFIIGNGTGTNARSNILEVSDTYLNLNGIFKQNGQVIDFSTLGDEIIEMSDIEYDALATKDPDKVYFVYETEVDNRTITAYDSNGNFLYKMSMYGCNNVGTLALSSKITEPPTITGTDIWGTGSYVFKTTFADGNTYYHNDAFTNGSTINIISNNSARVADAYGTNLFFAISGNRFTIMSAPDSAWISSQHLDGYNENSFAYGATETGNRKIYRNNKVYGKNENLGALAYKDTASGTAVTTVGTLPSLTYDSTTESFTFSAGTLPTTGTVTVS